MNYLSGSKSAIYKENDMAIVQLLRIKHKNLITDEDNNWPHVGSFQNVARQDTLTKFFQILDMKTIRLRNYVCIASPFSCLLVHNSECFVGVEPDLAKVFRESYLSCLTQQTGSKGGAYSSLINLCKEAFLRVSHFLFTFYQPRFRIEHFLQ